MKPGRDWLFSKSGGTETGTGVYELIASRFLSGTETGTGVYELIASRFHSR